MPAVKVVDFNGQDAGEMELSNVVFDAPLHVPAMHQVVVAHLANCRQGTHSTKTRGEVSGGGRKPWKQKHTGRARQGSTRSPIWWPTARSRGTTTRRSTKRCAGWP